MAGFSSGAVMVATGDQHACALKLNGTIWCWGNNASGQLGDQTTLPRRTPVQVIGITDAVQITASASFTCAHTRRRDLVLGVEFERPTRLGDNSTVQRSSPASVAILSGGVTKLAGGRDHNCALRSTGDVSCWGFNDSSQIGDGATVTRLQPVLASNVSGTIRSLALGGDSSCTVLAGGEGICWGNNDYGRLGNGSMTASLAVPQSITQWLLDDLIFQDDFED